MQMVNSKIDHEIEVNKRSFQLKQPRTAIGQRQIYSQGKATTMTQNMASTASNTNNNDQRLTIKERKQKLQNTFYDILNSGTHNYQQQSYTPVSQRELRGNHTNNLNTTDNQIKSHTAGNFEVTPMRDTSKQDWLDQYKNYQSKITINNSFKNNYLKYHLMRQLLEKKNLNEINQLKQRITDPEIFLKKGTDTQSGVSPKTSHGKHGGEHRGKNTSDSDESSEMSDDVEVFEFNQNKQPSIQNQSFINTKGNTSQGSVELKKNDEAVGTANYANKSFNNANNGINQDSPQKYKTSDNFGMQKIQSQMHRYQDQARTRTANTVGRQRNRLNDSHLNMQNQGNKSCVITKYNYCGRPPTSQTDMVGHPVAMRKRRLELIKKSANVKGCQKYNHRSRKADEYMREQENKYFCNEYQDQYADFNSFTEEPSYANNLRTLVSQQGFFQEQQQMLIPKKQQQMSSQMDIELMCAVETLNQRRLQPSVETTNELLGQMNLQKNSHTSKTSYSYSTATADCAKMRDELKMLKLQQIPSSVSNLYNKMQDVEHYNTKDYRPQIVNRFHKALITQGKREKEEIQNLRSVYTNSNKANSSHALKNLLSNQSKIKKTIDNKKVNPGKVQYFEKEEADQISSNNNQEDEIFVNWADVSQSFIHLMNTSKFGDFYGVSQKEQVLIKDFILSKYDVLSSKQVKLKIAKSHNQNEFNVIFLGKDTPLSKCCKLTLCMNISGELGNGKIYCMEKLCQFNPLTQFLIPFEVLQVLFPQNYDQYEQDTVAQPKIRQPNEDQINQELKKTVLAGSYKHMSLRKVVSGESRKKSQKATKKSGKQREDRQSELDSLFEEKSHDDNDDVEYLDVSYHPNADLYMEQDDNEMIKEEFTIDDRSDLQ